MKCTSRLFFSMLMVVTFSSCKEKENKQAVSAVNELPKMQITLLDNSQVATDKLTGNVVMILFQADCDHCQREANDIRENLNAFRDYTLYFISADQASAVHEFASDYNLLGQKNIYFAVTTVDDVIKNFGSVPAPSVYIYTHQRLLKKFNGEVAIERILEVI